LPHQQNLPQMISFQDSVEILTLESSCLLMASRQSNWLQYPEQYVPAAVLIMPTHSLSPL
jgi:hypothetical protein